MRPSNRMLARAASHRAHPFQHVSRLDRCWTLRPLPVRAGHFGIIPAPPLLRPIFTLRKPSPLHPRSAAVGSDGADGSLPCPNCCNDSSPHTGHVGEEMRVTPSQETAEPVSLSIQRSTWMGDGGGVSRVGYGGGVAGTCSVEATRSQQPELLPSVMEAVL